MSSETTPANEVVLQLKQSRIGSLMGAQVIGLGSVVPDNLVTNEDLAALGYNAQWIVQRTGILQRRHAPAQMATSDLAVEAAKRCIAQADVDPDAIDLVLVATFTPDMPMPATASLVQERLGLCAMAFDIQAACAGFVFAMITGMQYVASGCSRLALVIGADCTSRVLNPADEQTFPLFGDGAGAVLVASGSDQQGLVSYAVGSDGSGADLLCRPMGGSRLPYFRAEGNDERRFLYMAGRPIFRWAVRVLCQSIHEVLEAAHLTQSDVDLVILHQANIRIINAAVENLGIEPGKVFNNLDRLGNTSAASIPLALDEAARQGRIRRGDLILVSGFGGGLAWGTALMRW